MVACSLPSKSNTLTNSRYVVFLNLVRFLESLRCEFGQKGLEKLLSITQSEFVLSSEIKTPACESS